MSTIKTNKRTYRVDQSGYLINSNDWEEDFAEAISADAKLDQGLTDEHWKIIHWIRNYFKEYGRCPLIYETCRAHFLRLKDFKRLFPTGYQRGACKLAGLTYRIGFLGYPPVPESAEEVVPIDSTKTYIIDIWGFLQDPAQWDRQFAVFKAQEMKMKDKLTQKHWKIIEYLRDTYEKTKTVPTIIETCEANQLELDELQALFPDGYHRGAVKIAGLKIK